MEDSENCLFHIFLAPSKHIKSRVHVSIKEITLGWEVWKKCSVILLWAALPSLHTRPSSFFGLAVAEGAAAAAVSPVGQPRKAKRASSSHMGNLPWQAVFPHDSWHRCCGLGTCPLPSILSLLGTPWLLPSSAESLALPEPGISHCNHHKTSPSLEKFPGEGHFHVCPPQHIFSGQVKQEIINTVGSCPLKRETGDFHRQRRNLFFVNICFY